MHNNKRTVFCLITVKSLLLTFHFFCLGPLAWKVILKQLICSCDVTRGAETSFRCSLSLPNTTLFHFQCKHVQSAIKDQMKRRVEILIREANMLFVLCWLLVLNVLILSFWRPMGEFNHPRLHHRMKYGFNQETFHFKASFTPLTLSASVLVNPCINQSRNHIWKL